MIRGISLLRGTSAAIRSYPWLLRCNTGMVVAHPKQLRSTPGLNVSQCRTLALMYTPGLSGELHFGVEFHMLIWHVTQII